MRWIITLCAVLAMGVALPGSSVLAQRDLSNVTSDALIRVNGNVTVAEGDSNSIVTVVNDTAFIEGTVNTLVVIRGVGIVRGVVRENLIAVNGKVVLESGSHVRDIQLYSSTLTRDPEATVTGRIQQETTTSIGRGAAWVFWVSITLVALVLGLLAVALIGRQLVEATELFSQGLWAIVLTSLLLWVALPLLAFVCFITLIGIPLGFSILFGVMPLLWFLGFVVASLVLGAAVLQRRWNLSLNPSGRAFTEATIGIVLFQVIYLIPHIGGIIVLVASWLGSGALVLRSWRRWRERDDNGRAMEPAAPTRLVTPTPE